MKVFVADDDPISRRLLQVSLTNAGYEVTVAANGSEALRVAQSQDCPRLLVLDWMMPEVSGVEVCRAIRRRAQEPYVYVILLTAKGQQEEILEGLEAGADDYIIKPFDLQELKARLRAGKRILELQEQLMATREQLRVQATHDSLTGLLNRSAVLEAVEKEVARSQRESSRMAVVMGDIDHFKKINDTYGHAAGDAILRATAHRMRAAVRPYDVVGRYGGEEFLIVAPGCKEHEAAELAERLRKCVSQEVSCGSACTIAPTMSFGIAVPTTQLQGASQLLAAADEALYSAKKRGRNRVEIYSQPPAPNFASALR